MARINDNYLKLQAGYLFPEIARRVNAFCDSHPDANVIKMGIGDVTQPLCPAVVGAMHKAIDEMAIQESFRGYGPEQGYEFLRNAIAKTIIKIAELKFKAKKFLYRMARSVIREICSTFLEATTSLRF